jgi:hypothetical protein
MASFGWSGWEPKREGQLQIQGIVNRNGGKRARYTWKGRRESLGWRTGEIMLETEDMSGIGITS